MVLLRLRRCGCDIDVRNCFGKCGEEGLSGVNGGVCTVFEEAGDGRVGATVLEVDDDGTANGCILDHAGDDGWGGDGGGVDWYVSDDADVRFGVVDGIGGFGFVEVGHEGWCVGRG